MKRFLAWRWLALMGGLLIFGGIMTLYLSDTFMFRVLPVVVEDVISYVGVDSARVAGKGEKARRLALKLGDQLNPLLTPAVTMAPDGIVVVDVKLSLADVDYFGRAVEMAKAASVRTEDASQYRSVKVTVDGQTGAAKIRLRGDMPAHWAREKISFHVKSAKDQPILGQRELDFIIINDVRYLAEMFFHRLANQMGLFNMPDGFAQVRFNGVPQGIYYYRAAITPEFLEQNGFAGHLLKPMNFLFRDRPNWNISGGVHAGGGHITPFDFDIANWNTADLPPEVIYQLDRFLKRIAEGGDLGEFLDLDYMVRLEAWRMMSGGTHSTAGDNLRLLYESSSGRFYPFPRTEGDYFPLKVVKGGLDTYVNVFAIEGTRDRLFEWIVRNDDLRQRRNAIVYDWLTNHNLVGDFDQLMGLYGRYLTADTTEHYSTRHARYVLRDLRSAIAGNAAKILGNLEYAKVYMNVLKRGRTVSFEIMPDSTSALDAVSLKLKLAEKISGRITSGKLRLDVRNADEIDLSKFFRHQTFAIGLDENLHPERRVYKVEIDVSGRQAFEISEVLAEFRNEATGGLLRSPTDIHINIAVGDDNFAAMRYASARAFTKKWRRCKWSRKEDRLTLPATTCAVEGVMVIPEGLQVTISAGAKFKMAPGASVLSYSPLDINGREDRPVSVEPSVAGKPFGTFAVLGSGGDFKSNINYLMLGGGGGARLNGVEFSGALSLHHGDVDLRHSLIANNPADDGLNIKNADVRLEGNAFLANRVDQVDLDFTTGTVTGNTFEGPDAVVENGDGLDLSGSWLLVTGNRFANHTDKAISVGERTDVVVSENKIRDSNMGLAVKDLSRALVMDNEFSGNQVMISAYRKKPQFGGGQARLTGNSTGQNIAPPEVDEFSTISEAGLAAAVRVELSEAVARGQVARALEAMGGLFGDR